MNECMKTYSSAFTENNSSWLFSCHNFKVLSKEEVTSIYSSLSLVDTLTYLPRRSDIASSNNICMTGHQLLDYPSQQSIILGKEYPWATTTSKYYSHFQKQSRYHSTHEHSSHSTYLGVELYPFHFFRSVELDHQGMILSSPHLDHTVHISSCTELTAGIEGNSTHTFLVVQCNPTQKILRDLLILVFARVLHN